MARLISIMAILAPLMAMPAFAETATYGSIDLTGLSRASWHLNPVGESNSMVCNVNGQDGFVTIRSKPSSNSPSARKLKRLAIIVVDTSQRKGNWIRVVSAHRNHSVAGRRQTFKDLPVQGWVHDDFLCDFLD